MKHIHVEQGSPEWYEVRRGMVTGTRMDSVMGTSLERTMLACELIAEMVSTEQSDSFRSGAMERGIEQEPLARKHFTDLTGKKVDEIGFCISDTHNYLGVSGDGWIANDKGIYTEALEIKCPNTKTAIFYKISDKLGAEQLGLGSWSAVTKTNPESVFKPSAKAPFFGIPAEYKWQVVTYFMVNTDLEKLHFAVYDNRISQDKNKMHIVTVSREQLAPAITEAFAELETFREFWMKCFETATS